MKISTVLVFLFSSVFIHSSFSQYGAPTKEDKVRNFEKTTEPVRLLVEDIRKAVYASEEFLEDCLPPFTSASITLEGSNEKEGGLELNFVIFKISGKKKKGKTTKATIIFVRDTIFSPIMESQQGSESRNFTIIRNLIVSQAYANCTSNTAIKELSTYIEDETVPYSIMNMEKFKNLPSDKSAEAILSEAFKTQKLEVEVSFIVEESAGLEVGFKISPVTGTLTGNLNRKKVQTVKVIFGKDPS